jgi:AraC-like DNA-binding protein
MSDATFAELLLRGGAVGAQLALGIVVARSAPSHSLRLATLAFIFSSIAFVLSGVPGWRALAGPLYWPMWLVQIGGAGWFWLFARALFEDRRLRWRDALIPAALTLLGLVALSLPLPGARTVWTAYNVTELALALDALVRIVRSSRGDLVEARRRLRGPFLATIAAFSVAISVVQIGQAMGYDWPRYGLAFAAIQAALGLAGALVLLDARTELLGAAPALSDADPPAPVPTADAPWLARLDTLMREQQLWRREGLSLSDLAGAIGLPEHRLRRLINGGLGHRNFAAFVNLHRIEAARAALSDPAQATRTVASIAYDLGFGSLGPFNRAFRDATGHTPTEFRRAALAKGSPIPANPD